MDAGVSPTPYIQAVAPWLPANYPLKLQSLCQSSEDVLILEVVLRFLAGGDCPPNAAPRVRQEWADKQRAVMLSIQALRGPPGPLQDPSKRKRTAEPQGPLMTTAPKKPKMLVDRSPPPPHTLPPPPAHPQSPRAHVHPHASHSVQRSPPSHGMHTPSPVPGPSSGPGPMHPHALQHGPLPPAASFRPGYPNMPPQAIQSASAPPPPPPQAHPPSAPASMPVPAHGPGPMQISPNGPAPDELDPPLYTIYNVSCTSPIRKKVDITVGRVDVRLTNPSTSTHEHQPLPKSMFSRAFVLPTRGKSKPHWTVVILSSDEPGHPQIIFGVDALSVPGYKTTEYDPPYTSTTHHPKNTPTIPSLRALLKHFSNAQLIEPTAAVFRSAIEPVAHNATSTQPTPGKPEGVPGVEAYKGSKQGTLWFMREGILWGESKPCEFWACETLAPDGEALRIVNPTGRMCSIYLKREPKPARDGTGLEEGAETEFSMIDAREQPAISQWVHAHKHLFGASSKPHGSDVEIKPKPKREGYWGRVTLNTMPDDEDDEDEDYKASDGSKTEHGSPSGSSTSTRNSSSEGASNGSDSPNANSNSNSSDEGGEDVKDVMADAEFLREENHPLLRAGAMPKRISRAARDMVVDMVESDLGVSTKGKDKDKGRDRDKDRDHRPEARSPPSLKKEEVGADADAAARARGVPPPPPYLMDGRGSGSPAPSAKSSSPISVVRGNGHAHARAHGHEHGHGHGHRGHATSGPNGRAYANANHSNANINGNISNSHGSNSNINGNGHSHGRRSSNSSGNGHHVNGHGPGPKSSPRSTDMKMKGSVRAEHVVVGPGPRPLSASPSASALAYPKQDDEVDELNEDHDMD